MTKRVLTVLLSAAMLLGLLAGCGGSSATSTAASTTPTPCGVGLKITEMAATAKAATAAATEQKLPPVPRTGGFLREFLPQAPCLFGRSNVII